MKLQSLQKTFTNISSKYFHRSVLILLSVVAILTHVFWMSLNNTHTFGFWFGDGYVHYTNTLKHLNSARAFNFGEFLLPSEKIYDLYPTLIYQLNGLMMLIFGQSLTTGVMANSLFMVLLIISVYLVGRELWDKNTGLLSATVAVSIPIVQDNVREYQLDVQLASLVALGCYLLIKSKNFTNRKYTISFFAVMAFSSLVKWTAWFYVMGLFIISLWIMLSQKNKALKKQFAVMGVFLGISLIIPLAGRYHAFSTGQLGYGFFEYFTGIFLPAVFLLFIRLDKRIHEQFRDFFTGASLFVLLCGHFYYLKFWDLYYHHSHMALFGARREIDGIYYAWVFFNRFLQNNWLIFLVAGLIIYICTQNKSRERTLFIAGSLFPLLMFIFYPSRDARYLIPMIVFYAPLMTFWIWDLKNRAVRYATFALLMIQVLVSLLGWAMPRNSRIAPLIRQTYKAINAATFSGKIPTVLSSSQLEDLNYLVDKIESHSRDSNHLTVIYYTQPYIKTIENRHNFGTVDIFFRLLDEKGQIPRNISNEMGLYKNDIFYVNGLSLNSADYSYWPAPEEPQYSQLTSILADKYRRLYIFGEDGFFAVVDSDRLEGYHQETPCETKSTWISPSGVLHALFEDNGIFTYEQNRWMEFCRGKPSFNKIIAFSNHELIAVGSHGEVSCHKEGRWIPMGPEARANFNAIWGTGSESFYVAGSEGIIYHYHQGRWNKIPSPHKEEILCIFGFQDQRSPVYFAGTKGLILELSNGTLKRIYSGVGFEIESIWGGSPDDIYFSGDSSDILHLKKGKIRIISPDTPDKHQWESLTGNDDGVFAAGSNNTILHIRDGNIQRIHSLRSLPLYRSILAIRLCLPGEPLRENMPFRNQIKKFYPYRGEFYTIEELPGTGNHVEIFEYQ